jgi:predicted O-methyltransferase YrrM
MCPPLAGVTSLLKRIVKRLLLKQFKNPRVRRLFEAELSATYPLLSNKQLLSNNQLAFAPPGHYYSPLPDIDILNREGDRLFQPNEFDGVDLRAASQLGLLEELAPLATGFDWPAEPTAVRRYYRDNGWFEDGDAVVLFSMIRRFLPRRIVEVGSGYSSALMLDTNDLNFNSQMQLTFIDPNPDDRLSQLLRPADRAATTVIPSEIQRVSLDLFDTLEKRDILFIDSSHVSKIGSDVNHLLFNVLPRLREGVLVHFHDIFYPFEYPTKWLREGRAWNETYMLRAFLQFNSAFEILFFNSYMLYKNKEITTTKLPSMAKEGVSICSSIWLRKRVGPLAAS